MIVAGAAVVFSGCYKEPQPAQAYDVLTRHKWKIEAHVFTTADSGGDCRVPAEVEFERDSTGYFIYNTPCAPGDPQKRTFRWTVSYDNLNIHYTDLDGKPKTSHLAALQHYDDQTLRLRSELYEGYYWDGYFRAFEDK